MNNEQGKGGIGEPSDSAESFEKALERQGTEKFLLRLYITGTTPKSVRALSNIKSICEEHLMGNYDLEVIDVYQHPTLIEGDQIIAIPTLIKKIPAPLRRIIGDLSNKEKVLLGLDLKHLEE